MNILVTGGHGFIGSNFIKNIIDKPEVNCIVNIDCPTKLCVAADWKNVEEFKNHSKYSFYDIWLETILLRDKFKQIGICPLRTKANV